MLESLQQVRARVRDAGVADRLDRLRTWVMERWQILTPAIGHRLKTGRVRECHGDLHRANIALAHGEPLFFDGIEFNPGLRWIDTASELAFLIMDLEEAGTPGLAGRLLNQYLEHTGDFGALEVLDLYKVYRAMVRAKVLAIRLDQADLTAAQIATERCDCARYLALAESYTHTRRPRLLIACGLSGSGKSTLARGLCESLPMIHLRSDVERKRLFGLPGEARSDAGHGAGIYFSQATAWTYRQLHSLADGILACNYDVVVDATFLTQARRTLFHDLALRQGAGFAVIALMAPLGLLRSRVAQRLAAGDDASEASLAVLEHQRAVWERLSLAERRNTILINSTDLPPLPNIVRQIAELAQ
jgi:predicted kinase